MKKNFKKKIIAIIFIIIALIAVVAICKTVSEMKVPEVSVEGGVTYLKFPFEKLAELPKEPNWEKDADAWEILEEARKQNEKINNFIKEEVERSGASSFVYVNKNGDIMMNEEISLETEVHNNIAFFKSESNSLVVIEFTVMMIENKPITVSIHRHEYFSTTQRFRNGEKFVARNKQINGMGHYYFKDDTLYYFVKCNEEWNVQEIATGKKVSGSVDYSEGNITYPIIERDGQLYTYVIEEALPNEYAYYVENESISIREIKLSEEEGTFKIEEDYFGNQKVKGNIEQGKYEPVINLSKDLDVSQSNNFSECCKQIINTKTFMYSDSASYVFSYWEKDATVKHYF